MTALVLGLLGTSLLAVVFGHVARSQCRRTGQSGSGMALAGLVLGYIGLAISAGIVVLVLVASAKYSGTHSTPYGY